MWGYPASYVMTNFEYWRDRIIAITEKSFISVECGNPVASKCEGESCNRCDFFDGKGVASCNRALVKWLYSEHEEKPKLTRRERTMCELLKTGWIAMDDDGSIFWHEKRPERDYYGYFNSDGEWIGLSNFKLQFDNVPIGVEAYAVEDLLQLEVEE